MLDPRKPYIIKIEDKKRSKRDRINFRSDEGLPSIAIKAKLEKFDGEKEESLTYYDIGCERGHLLEGRVKKQLRNGIVFLATELNWEFTLTELTMEEFEARVRPGLPEEISIKLQTLDDVYIWYRKMVEIV